MFSPHSEDVAEDPSFISKMLFKNLVASTKAQGSNNSVSDSERNSDGSETSSIITDPGLAMPVAETLPTTSTKQQSTIAGAATTEEAAKTTTSNASNCFSSVSSGRTLSSVIKGLKRIIAGKAYKDSDFRQYWMPDSNCKECYECGKMFNPFRRRHHCRICGQIFCSACCSQEVPGKTVGQAGSLRCCNYCMTVVTQYISDIGLDGQSSIAIQPNILGSPKYSRGDPLAVDSQTKSDGTSGMRGDPTSSTAILNSLVRRPSSQLKSSIFDEDLKGFNVDDGNIVCSPVESLQKERKALLQEACQLQDLWFSMRDKIQMQNVRFLLKSYDCIAASHIVDWFIENDKALTREQAAVLGQALLDGKWLESIDGKVTFRDNARVFYRPTEMAMKRKPSLANLQTHPSGIVVEEGEPLWVKEILRREDGETGVTGEHRAQEPLVQEDHLIHHNHHHHHLMDTAAGADEMTAKSVFYLDFDCPSKDRDRDCDTAIDDINRALDKDGDKCHDHGKEDIDLEPTLAPRSSQDLSEPYSESDNKDKLKNLLLDHLNQLTNQLLKKRHIDSGWVETIFSIGSKVTNSVKPNTRLEDEMDIRHYLKIKKIPGNDRSNWQMINGVVFSKNVTHKKMRHSIDDPRILLISAPIEYQRIENKMSSLQPQILQEREFLKKCVHRIMTMKPDLVLVEKSVSRIAQEYLYEAGITLVINVKQCVLLRVSRMTQATIVSSIDGLVNKTNLGTCSRFHLQTFFMENGTSKTLMFLDGCNPTLGCSVILRGGPLHELQRVKETLEFVIYAMYHMNFELSFLLDEHAHLPKVDLTSQFGLARQDGLTSGSSPRQPPSQDPFHPESNTSTNYACISPGEHRPDTSVNKETFKITPESKNVSGEPKQERQNLIEKKIQSIAEDDNDGLLLEKQFREKTFLECISGKLLLSISPNVNFKLPFLETKEGKSSVLRKFFIKGNLYWSKELEDDSNDGNLYDADEVVKPDCVIMVNGETQEEMKFGHVFDDSGGLVFGSHPFVYGGIGSSSLSVQNILADFRARGGKPLASLSTNKNQSYFSQSKILSKNNPTSYNEKESDHPDNPPDMGLDSLDCLIPENHQRISVLFTSISLESANFPSPCVLPWVVTMNFYSHTDITLGGFLEKFCYNENYKCVHAHCETPMKEHVRRFVHGSGCLQVTLKKVESPSLPLLPSASSMSSLSGGGGGTGSSSTSAAGGGGSAIATKMWSYCKLCLQKTPVTQMSPETYGLSFGKYLELRFYAQSYVNRPGSKCNHSLHQDYVQIFDCGLLRAAFKYSSITILSIYLPPMIISVVPVPFSPDLLYEEGVMLNYRIEFCFETITENLLKLKKELASSDNQYSLVMQCVEELEHQKQGIDQKVQYVLSLVNSLKMLGDDKSSCKANSSLGIQISDAFVDIHRNIAAIIQLWTEKLSELETTLKKPEKSSKSFSSSANLSSFVSPVATTTAVVSPPPPEQNAQTDGSLTLNPSFLMDQFNTAKVTSPSSTTAASKVSKSNTTPVQISTLATGNDFPTMTSRCTNSAENEKAKTPLIKKTSSFPVSLTQSILIADKPVALKLSDVDPAVVDSMAVAEENTYPNVGQNQIGNENSTIPFDEQDTREILKMTGRSSTPSIKDLKNLEICKIYKDNKQDDVGEIKRNISSEQCFNDQRSHRERQPITSFDSLSEKEGISVIIGGEDSIACDDVAATADRSGSCDSCPTSLSSSVAAAVPQGCKKHFEEVFVEDASSNKSTPTLVDNTAVVDGSSVTKLVSKKGKTSTSSKESSIAEPSSDKKVNMKQIFSNFLSNSVTCINDPIPSDEHHLLPECLKVPVVVYDKEPSSIIAYALSSKEYEQKMKELKMKLNEHLNTANSDLEESKKAGAILSFLKTRDKSPNRSDLPVTSTDVGGVRNFDRIDIVRYVPQYDLEEKETQSEDSVSSLPVPHSQNSKLQKVQTSVKADVKAQQQPPSEHIELQFSDNSTKFYCKVCFAEQFESLRKIIFPEGEESFIRSLSRCITWFARGGKSGSNFCKTKDNRFILKQMSLREVQSFGPFARHYFTHILQSCRSGKPTTIAKIVGVFKVVYQNSKTSETLNQDLLIMENLFYNRKILQIYDLKGSMRNRMVNTCGKKPYEDLVLLDENLIRAMVDSPLYVHTHSKLILMSAITRDSEFLANHLIMDYSLLVGVDEENELVVGIIDYIRTFTWDKRVEMIVKTTYGSKMPTVVSPEIYRRRFLDAMDRYFLAVPDKWKGLGKNLTDALV